MAISFIFLKGSDRAVSHSMLHRQLRRICSTSTQHTCGLCCKHVEWNFIIISSLDMNSQQGQYFQTFCHDDLWFRASKAVDEQFRTYLTKKAWVELWYPFQVLSKDASRLDRLHRPITSTSHLIDKSTMMRYEHESVLANPSVRRPRYCVNIFSKIR